METLEPTTILHTQEVRGSSPCVPPFISVSCRFPRVLEGVFVTWIVT